MAAQGVTIEAMRALMRRYGFELCEKCVARYTPCAALMLQYTVGGIVHIAPAVYYCDDWGGEKLPRRSWAGRFCDGQRFAVWRRKFVAVHKAFAEGDFVVYLLERYPSFTDKPITVELQEQEGCDLEAELAMWSLSK
jgi:hypothetical protein